MISRRMLLAAGIAAGFSAPAMAQDAASFPNKPITFVVSFSAGGSTDVLARAFAEDFSRIMKVPVVVENRPGAGGYVALRTVATAAPDGYTLLFAENALGINAGLNPNREIKPSEGLEAIARIGTAPLALILTAKLAPKSFAEFVAFSKTLPNGIDFASSGVGSVSHMTFQAMMQTAGIKGSHIPFKGGGEATAAVVGGHTHAMLSSVGSSKRLESAGEVKVLAVTDSQRSPEFPAVPTLDELGIKAGIELRFWWGLFGPKALPVAIRDKLEQGVAATLKDKDALARLQKIAVSPSFAPSAEMAKTLQSEVTNWSKFVKDNNIKAE